jgi:hypothetical protein
MKVREHQHLKYWRTQIPYSIMYKGILFLGNLTISEELFVDIH